MEDQELRQRLDTLEKEMAEVHKLSRRIYFFFLTTIIASVVMFVLPLLLLTFEIPALMSGTAMSPSSILTILGG